MKKRLGKISALSQVKASYGGEIPNWIEILAAFVDKSGSLRKASIALGDISPATISQILNNRYPAKDSNIALKICNKLMSDNVFCPVLGAISTIKCSGYQKQEFSTTSSMIVKIYQACRSGCAFSKLKG